MKYNYLIVGAGLYGSVFARKKTDEGYKCLVIDKRNHIGGNCYTEVKNNITIHKHGIHIFHCDKKETWDFVNKYSEFIPFINTPIANYKGELYNLPFNMNTFYQLWGTKTPSEARNKINSQLIVYNNPQNIEEYALSNVGVDIYKKLIMGYTYKQWGKDPKELPVFIIKRLPLRFTFDNNYYNDKYQGVPKNGYTDMIANILKGIDVKTKTDFFKNKEYFESVSDNILFTGKIDEFFKYKYGKLDYRSLRFEEKILKTDNYQGNAVVNYTDNIMPFTRIIEHKHIAKEVSDCTIITKEYPQKYSITREAYYPINDKKNNDLYEKYKNKLLSLQNYIVGGRLGEYKYYDMHQIIEKIYGI